MSDCHYCSAAAALASSPGVTRCALKQHVYRAQPITLPNRLFFKDGTSLGRHVADGRRGTAEFIIARNLITADTAMMPRMTREERRRLVIELCEKDEYQLILLLDEGYEITAADVEHIDARQMLGYACVNGNLELAVWLANRFEFGAQDVVDIHLERVCSNGHARILGWLTDRFHLTAKYIRTRSMLFNACLSGDLDFVRWLVGRSDYGARRARGPPPSSTTRVHVRSGTSNRVDSGAFRPGAAGLRSVFGDHGSTRVCAR